MTPKNPQHLVLTMFMTSAGYHKDAWRLPSTGPAAGQSEFAFMQDLALMCEAAKLDAIFFADVVSAALLLNGNSRGTEEPLTMMSALAAHTERIGLISTFSTTFTEPYNLARQLSGLDTISGGRVGWNIVTSVTGSENFGGDPLPSSADRYRRATEFVEVVSKLWDSWSDDAVIDDRVRGLWLDPAKLRAIDHAGEFYRVRGPLNMVRSPQGRPVAVQAGVSEEGIALGASVADAIYTTQPEKQGAIEFTAKYRQRVRESGRDPRSIKILPGIMPIVGRSDTEAAEIAQMLADNIDYAAGKESFAQTFDLRLHDIDIDDRIPSERFPEEPGAISFPPSRYRQFRGYALEDGWTLRELIAEKSRAGGHLWTVGSASRIADLMIDWFESGACDGFNLNPPYVLEGARLICELLVPELQERGYFRSEYEGTTLREHLGLERPGAWDAR